MAVGRRIRELREERGLTAEKLAFESDLQSKGFLSDIEAGLASPSLRTLQTIAAHLNVLLADLVTFPDRSEREQLIDRTRWLTPGVVRRMLRDMPARAAAAPRLPPAPERTRSRGPAKTKPYPPRAAAKTEVVAEPASPRPEPRPRRSPKRSPKIRPPQSKASPR